MVDLSVIIVNYNVRYFLEQCLLSIQKAAKNLSVEIIVVDNLSTDNSLIMLQEKFPHVNVIANKSNVGFSRANNQGFAIAKGQYILVLNPDTILSEDSLDRCKQYMDDHEKVGAMCVRMIDGSGNYLPESKRGLPTLSASIYKMTGWYKLFPKSAHFNAYYAGHIGEFETAEIEIMTGAFMFVRKSIIDTIGGFDEQFFMYGEDIDFSYRIGQTGSKIVYYPDITIIHFKGESTKKSSFNYTKSFYQAMSIFVKKHYNYSGGLYITLLNMAVYFKGFMSLLKKWVLRLLPFILDFVLCAFALMLAKNFWVDWYYNNTAYINSRFEYVNVPLYAGIWIFILIISGHYARQRSFWDIIKSVAVGTALILGTYALLPNELRNSRVMILMGSVLTLCIVSLTKSIYNLLTNGRLGLKSRGKLNYVVVASPSESAKIRELIHVGTDEMHFMGRIAVDQDIEGSIGQLADLKSIVEAYHIDEVIFAQKDVLASNMMSTMSQMHGDVDFRVAPEDALSIIKSRSKNTQGNLVTVDLNFQINHLDSIQNKRMFDVITSIILLVLSPILILFYKNKLNFIYNIINVLIGRLTWVGYIYPCNFNELPSIKKNVIPCISLPGQPNDQQIIDQENLYYAQNYTAIKDIELLIKNIKALDGKHA